MWAVCGLTLVAATGGFGFTSQFAAQEDYEYYYEVICDGYHVVPYMHPNATVSEAQCHAKCAGGGGAGCGGYDVDVDGPDSDSLCLPAAECKELCWSLDECHSLEIKSGVDRCYFNRWDCADRDLLTNDTDYTLYAKKVPWQSECSAELSVKVTGSDLADGKYLFNEDDENEFIRGDGMYRVHWSGCEWRIQRTVDIPSNDTMLCDDDVAAANFLFGLGDDENAVGVYDDHICARGKVAGYCGSELFAGICAATCRMNDVDRCKGDNHIAAEVLADLWGLDITDCTLCTVATETSGHVGGYDPVVQSICKTTCGPPEDDDGNNNGNVRRLGSRDLTAFQVLEGGASLVNGRKLLGNGMMWKDYFWANYSQNQWLDCGLTDARDIEGLTDDTICDVIRFESVIPGLHMEKVCPEQACYSTTDGEYCPFQNVDTSNPEAGSVLETMRDNLCAVRCVDDVTGNCAGNDPFFLKDSEAVCLPREECEEICTGLGDLCVGIDMHRTLPRCYINTKCDDPVQFDANYRRLTKNTGRGCYDTESDKYCEGGNLKPALFPEIRSDACVVKCSPFGPECVGDACFCWGADGLEDGQKTDSDALCLNRAMCEEKCSQLDGCGSFDMHQSLPRCYLNMINENNGEDCAEPVVDAAYERVAKRADAGCYPQIIRTESAADDAYGYLLEGLDGHYSHRKANNFTRVDDDNTLSSITIGWDDCHWRISRTVEGEHMWEFSSVFFDDAIEGCGNRRLDDNDYHADSFNSDLFFASCPERPPAMMLQVCEGVTECPVLTRCVVSEEEMTTELQDRPTERSQSLSLSNSCSDHIKDITKFISRQLASPTRAEASLDLETYGPRATTGDDLRVVDYDVMLLRRDDIDATESKLTLIPTAVHAVNVISSHADHTMTELGATYAVPDGYVGYMSDVVRVEAFGVDCASGTGNITIAFHVGDGALAKAFTMSATNPDAVATTSTMDGDWLSVTVSATASIDVAVALDDNECGWTVTPCSEHATCTNTIGSWQCACPVGYTGEGSLTSPCEEVIYGCDPLSFRVSNAQALDFGWRVREMRLYVDDQCADEVELPATLYQVASGKGCGSTGLITTSTHSREMIRGNNCNTKCGAGAGLNVRRLSRGRRQQELGSDWSNCAGMETYAGLTGESQSNLMCASKPTCEQACNQLEECAAYVMTSDNSCLLYSSCTSASASGSTSYLKSTSWALKSSPAFEGHPVSLVYDSNGLDDTTDDNYLFTEWWSNCFSCGQDDAWIEISITPSPNQACKVEGMKVWQDPNNAADSLNLAQGPRDRDALPLSAGVRPDLAREKPDMGAPWTATWSYDVADHSGHCMPMTCGTKDTMLQGTVLKSIDGVVSPCLCKQYCLDHIDQGCTSWRLNLEEDSNFNANADIHQHIICDLLTGDLVSASVPHWISGNIDTVIQSFGPTEANPSELFTLTINGVGLPEKAKGGKQRVKIVAADEGCSAKTPDTLSGIGCSDNSICGPRPSTYVHDKAAWDGVALATGADSREYTVCYCVGPCFADWQYVAIPSSNLLVEATHASWETTPAEIARDTASFQLHVNYVYPLFNVVKTWRIKLVERSKTCAAAEGNDDVTFTDFVRDEVSGWETNWTVTLTDAKASAGKYHVCYCMVADADQDDADALCDPASPWVPISSEESRYINIGLTDADLAPPTGYARGQRFSGRAGKTVTIDVAGTELLAEADTSKTITLQAGGCDTVSSALEFTSLDDQGVTTEGVYTDEVVKFSGGAPPDAGVYALCLDITGGNYRKLGEFTVTDRIDLGWTYIFDPNLDGSLEITGDGLDWKKDRMMIVPCTATCGLSSPASDAALLDGTANTLKASNQFVALNEEFDLQGNETSGYIAQPSEMRTYVRRPSSYCRAGNLHEEDVTADIWAHSCHSKCATDPDIAGCEGYSPEHDGADSSALCMSEVQCREACSGLDVCFGIDMYKDTPRCYLNQAGDLHGCKMQTDEHRLGSSSAYDFLAKDSTGVTQNLVYQGAVSSDTVLRFAPIGFARNAGGAGKFKVCFCDSALLPPGRDCLQESDYGLEIGELYVSGVSCLLANPLFRRGTCYNMVHGGLACSDELEIPSLEAMPTTAGLPTSWASFPI